MNEFLSIQNLSKKDKLLAFLKLDIDYYDGKDDWLFYRSNTGEIIEVLDIVGSYGINFLGYKNPVYEELNKQLPSFPPNFIQVSSNPETQRLSNNLIKHLSNHTSKSDWVCEFANTGSEIIETAIKLIVLDYQRRIEQVRQEIYYSINWLEKNKSDNDLIQEIGVQLVQIEKAFYVIHFEGSFHGKTLGSLSLMGDLSQKSHFPVVAKTISSPKDHVKFIKIINNYLIKYRVWNPKLKKLIEKKFLPIAGIFFEPIQGEAGVYPLSTKLIDSISKIKKTFDIPVVSDEIQCGLYRTGYMSVLNPELLIADIYCFGKALGAGLAKISALCCVKKRYRSNFFKYHTSSFGEDHYSSWAANQFLKTIEYSSQKIELIKSNWIYNELINFKIKNSDIIKDVRGVGNMLSIELDKKVLNQSYITKFLKDLNLIGYWVSSVLLNKECIRILPTLSNPTAFRMHPSIQFNQANLSFMLKGFHNLFEAFRNKDVTYLFDHIIPLPNKPKLKNLCDNLREEKIPEGAAFFICHPIDLKHICNIIDLIEGYKEPELNKILDELQDYQKFTMCHIEKLTNKHGKEIDIIILAVPLTSVSFYRALRSGKRKDWIKKIQEAVDFANSHNAKSIGLGQFTSIITGNGLFLSSPGATLTTGNAFTAGLTIEAIHQTLKMQGKNAQNTSLSIIGAGGNIVQIIGLILVQQFKCINLVYHAGIRESKKIRKQVISFLESCLTTQYSFALKSRLKKLVKQFPLDSSLELLLDNISDLFKISSSIDSVAKDDVIIIGTNDTGALLNNEHIKKGAILVDIAVPPNSSESLQKRRDITFIKGGIASLPLINGEEQDLNSMIIPLGSGECYACMAETFGLGFESDWKEHNIGDLTREIIDKTMIVMESHGFNLKRIKVENSI